MKYLDAVEIVTGLVLDGADATLVDVEALISPQREIVEAMQSGDDLSAVTERFGPAEVARCTLAAKAAARVASQTKLPFQKWVEMLQHAHAKHNLGEYLITAGKKLRNDEEVNDEEILERVSNHNGSGVGHGFVDIGEVEEETIHFKPSYWPPLDQRLGGLPIAGLVTLASLPKLGKTTLTLDMAGAVISNTRDEYVGYITCEQRDSELKGRLRQVTGLSEKKKIAGRMKVHTGVKSSKEAKHEIRRLCRSKKKPYCIFIDSADRLVVGEVSEAQMSMIYRDLAEVARDEGVPIVLVAHLKDEAYRSGLPRVEHIRWSRQAIAESSVVLLIHNPFLLWSGVAADGRLPPVKGSAWIIIAASRHGIAGSDQVGAFRVIYDPKTGWGDKSLEWRTLSHNEVQ